MLKLLSFVSPKRFQIIIARYVQSVHSVHVVLKIETTHFTIHFQFQTMTQHFLVMPWGKPISPEIETGREREREQFTVRLY